VTLKIPAGQDRGRPARDGLAGGLAPDRPFSALPGGRLGLGPGHGIAEECAVGLVATGLGFGTLVLLALVARFVFWVLAMS